MTKLGELQLKQSELRERGNALLNKTDRTEGETAELREATVAAQQLEIELRAAIVLEDEADKNAREASTDPEALELRQLTNRSNLGTILSAAVERRSTEGPEAELQQHHGLASNQVPLDLLRLRPEERALTPAPTNVETQQDQIVEPVFANAAGAFLGVYQPTVAAGDAVFPVLTSRPTVGGPHTDDTDVPETTGAFDSELLAPGRVQASFFWKRTSAARFPMMEPSLRISLNGGLGEKTSLDIVNGSNGLLNGTNLPNHNTSTLTTFANYISNFCFGRVDGRYATDQKMLRVLMGSATYGHAGSVYRSGTADFSALDSLMAKTGGVQVSAHVPAVSGNKQNSVIRLGMRRDMVQPLWNGVTIIVDEVTRSGKGEIEVTAVLLLATKIIRRRRFLQTANATRIRAGLALSLVENESLIVSVELRASEADDSPGTISGLILPIGRIAADRKEVFTPDSATFPAGGVRLLLEHQGREVMVFEPVATSDGYHIEAALPPTPEGVEAAELVKSGKRSALSVEFRALEAETVSQVREVRSALMSRRPRSFLRAHTNKREPSSEGASFDGGFEMALTAVEAMDAAEQLVDALLHESSRRNTDRRDSEARHASSRVYPDDGTNGYLNSETNPHHGNHRATSHVRLAARLKCARGIVATAPSTLDRGYRVIGRIAAALGLEPKARNPSSPKFYRATDHAHIIRRAWKQ